MSDSEQSVLLSFELTDTQFKAAILLELANIHANLSALVEAQLVIVGLMAAANPDANREEALNFIRGCAAGRGDAVLRILKELPTATKPPAPSQEPGT